MVYCAQLLCVDLYTIGGQNIPRGFQALLDGLLCAITLRRPLYNRGTKYSKRDKIFQAISEIFCPGGTKYFVREDKKGGTKYSMTGHSTSLILCGVKHRHLYMYHLQHQEEESMADTVD